MRRVFEICLLVGAVSVAHGAQLPQPTGQFGVGRVTYHWTDPSRPEPMAGVNAHRELMVYVWYPIARGQAGRTADYMTSLPQLQKLVTPDDLKDMLRPATEEIEKNGFPETHAITDAPMAKHSRRFPVLLFSHGWGLETRLCTATLEDLASHGYVVAAIDHPYDTTVTIFPNGRAVHFAQQEFDAAVKQPHGFIDYAFARVEVMAKDVSFVLDELAKYDHDPSLGAPFAGHLDLQRVGAFGHSIGGMTSARACELDSRLRACLDEDSDDDRGSPFPSTEGHEPNATQPFLFFVATSSDIFSPSALHPTDKDLEQQKLTRAQYDATLRKDQQEQNAVLGRIKAGSYRVILTQLPGFTHRSFTDLPLIAADHDPKLEAESLHDWAVAEDYIRAFFDKYLKGAKSTVLDRPTPVDSRVRVDRFNVH